MASREFFFKFTNFHNKMLLFFPTNHPNSPRFLSATLSFKFVNPTLYLQKKKKMIIQLRLQRVKFSNSLRAIVKIEHTKITRSRIYVILSTLDPLELGIRRADRKARSDFEYGFDSTPLTSISDLVCVKIGDSGNSCIRSISRRTREIIRGVTLFVCPRNHLTPPPVSDRIKNPNSA